ncbi:PREDICTED: DNA-directed RNA polymerase III subunit RPC3-like isoform X2 [Priapulus caudatus]|uniref:DNA-directed RNA polymerase III subunit RPC3 n=1 Tax=Priapulus caudatus TaxID=37621 RepID=A0ABM1DVV1_PRICU|nr:PREDICTED: DNA-directed RNA polymerase III subunit RPC3-like isoform X2 [Priapulus caudatus]
MSEKELIACSLLLREYFGEIVEAVSMYLARKGSTPLRVLVDETKLNIDKVRKALCVLTQHNMVTFDRHKRGFVMYTIDVKEVLLLARYTRYIYCAKTLYGDAAELIAEEMLLHGQVGMESVCQKVENRLNEALDGKHVSSNSVTEKFANLAQTHFIQRSAMVKEDEDDAACSATMPVLVSSADNQFTISAEESDDSRKRKREEGTSTQSKKHKTGNEYELSECNNLWKVNYDRFHQHFRDLAIISAVANKIDKRAGEVMRTMLRISEVKSDPIAEVSAPMSSNEIFQALPKELGIKSSDVDQYLNLLTEDSAEFVGKLGESGGGTYTVNIKKAITEQAKATIESVVQERFSSKAARIFRLLLRKKYLEQKQIEECAMIPAKEAKDLTYTLFAEAFLSLQEIPRTPDHAPSRTIYLFTVNITQVCRMLLDRCYKALSNIVSKRHHVVKEFKRLLEKQQRVEAIVASLKTSGSDEAQIREVEEMITPPERTQLQKVEHMTTKLEQSKIQLDETIFILRLNLSYCVR